MKVEFKPNEKILSYPKILQSKINNEIVLATKECPQVEDCFEGFVLSIDSRTSHFGDFFGRWPKNKFKPYEGSITLSNE